MNFRVKISNPSLFLFFYLAVLFFTIKEGYGQVSVKKWADDKKSAFSLTFDDCCMSQFLYAAPVLDSFKFKGSFFVISGSGFMTDSLPGIARYGTWAQFRAMALNGHEIGSHSVTHPHMDTLTNGDTSTPGTLLYELYQSKKTIEQKIPNQKCITIAYPYEAYNSNVLTHTSNYYSSARTGGTYPVDGSLAGLDYYIIGGKEALFNLPRNSTADDLDELTDFEKYLDTTITKGKWGVLEAHEVVPFSQIPQLVQQGEWYPMSAEWLTSLCQWLKQKSDSNQVWVESMGNITRYMHERQDFMYDFYVYSETQIQMHGYDTLNDEIYNYPLTVDITVPSDWKAAIFTQGSRTDTIYTFISGGSTYLRTHIIPDGGIIVMNRLTPVLTISALIEGLYNNTTMVSDTVTVELRNTSSPFTLVDSTKGILNTSGVGTFSFINAVNGTPYYLVIKHRNAIETWSSEGHGFTSFALSYDFTNSKSQAYGNNLVLKDGKYCIYSGDVNQDGLVDLSDLVAVDNDIANSVTGLTNTDLNGDESVDLKDLIIVDNNNNNYITKIIPLLAPAAKDVKKEIQKLNNNLSKVK